MTPFPIRIPLKFTVLSGIIVSLLSKICFAKRGMYMPQ